MAAARAAADEHDRTVEHDVVEPLAGREVAGRMGSVGVSPVGLEAAGGIGGLLAMQDPDNDGYPYDPNDFELNYVYTYDGNGNVGQLVAWEPGYGGAWGYMWDTAPPTNARLAARYEYAPYGNPLLDIADANESGPYAGENPFRFSTKYWDDETGLGCWPLRYYDPAMGRWTSHDPLGERAGLNLYEYAECCPASVVDPLGLIILNPPVGAVMKQPPDPRKFHYNPKTNTWKPWGSGPGSGNCYRYACDNPPNPNDRKNANPKANPGGTANHMYAPSPAEACTRVMRGAAADGLMPTCGLLSPAAPGCNCKPPDKCPEGTRRVAFFLGISPGSDGRLFWDFHVYREYPDGTWCHKPGENAVSCENGGTPITDPVQQPATAHTYFCGYMCVR